MKEEIFETERVNRKSPRTLRVIFTEYNWTGKISSIYDGPSFYIIDSESVSNQIGLDNDV